MKDNIISDILGLQIPLGFCIDIKGDILWYSDVDNKLALEPEKNTNINSVLADGARVQILSELSSLEKSDHFIFAKPVAFAKTVCYVNVKCIGYHKEKKSNLYILELTPFIDSGKVSTPKELVKIMGSVNVDQYVRNLGVPFSLFHILRDKQGEPCDLEIVMANQAYAELAGKSVDELVGASYKKIYSDIDTDFIGLLGGICQESGSAKFIDFEKGLKRYTEISAYSPINDIVGCVYNDITDLVLANKSLQQEEEYIRTLIEVNPDIIFVFSQNGEFLDCHVSDISQLFFSKKDFIGKQLDEVLDPNLVDLTQLHIDSVIQNKRIEEYQYSVDVEAETKFFEARMVPHDVDRVVCIVRDITSKKLVEAELEKHRKDILNNNQFLTEVMEGVGYPLWVVDVKKGNKFIISDINSQYQEVFGIAKHSMKGLELEEIKKYYDKTYYDSVISQYFDCLKNKKPTTHERVLIDEKTQKRVYLLVTLMPKLDEKGKVYRIIGSATDITGLKKTQDDLIMAKEKALEADKLKSTFLANMSHEIRTPLNSITGFSELIQDEDLTPEERQDMCRIIEKNSSQLLKLVNDIIEISKIESEQIKLIYRKFDINHLLGELVQELELDMYRKKKVLPFKINKHFKEGYGFNSDEFRIKQVFQHLLDNALKFTSEGELEFGYIVHDDESVEFYVQDSGIGIPADKQDSIFELFRQLDESSTRKYGGTGLGLSICKRLVSALDGEMWVESELNKGARFAFKLSSVKTAID